MTHNYPKFGWRRLKNSRKKQSIVEDLTRHCDFDHEDRNPDTRTDHLIPRYSPNYVTREWGGGGGGGGKKKNF